MPGLGHNWLREGYCHGPFGLFNLPYATGAGVNRERIAAVGHAGAESA